MAHRIPREELKRIKQERKKLRKTLREKGIKSRADFESFAREVGLGYPAETLRAGFIGAFVKGTALLKVMAASTGIYGVLGAAAVVLGATFTVAYVTEEKGHFTINLTADMMQEGYVLSESEDFSHESTRLFSEEMTNVNAISIQDILPDVDEGEGAHNGSGYMAYTFYIKNAGTTVSNYTYALNITSETQNAVTATWAMVFVDGRQMIYAKLSEDGDRENLFGYLSRPFGELAREPDALYYEEDGRYGIRPVEFAEEYVVTHGLVEGFEPGDVTKYTVVIWLEGDDPQCTNDIMGGHVGFNFQFERVEEDDLGIFKGLYREEYYDAQNGILIE